MLAELIEGMPILAVLPGSNDASRIFAAAMAEGYRERPQRTARVARQVPAERLLTLRFAPRPTGGDPILDEGLRAGYQLAALDVNALLEGYLELSEAAIEA